MHQVLLKKSTLKSVLTSTGTTVSISLITVVGITRSVDEASVIALEMSLSSLNERVSVTTEGNTVGSIAFSNVAQYGQTGKKRILKRN